MRRFALFIVLLALIIGAKFYKQPASPQKQLVSPVEVLPTPTVSIESTTSVFIPYWNVPDSRADIYTPDDETQKKPPRLVYFGIKANKKGIDTTDTGFKQLISSPFSYDAVTLRLLDTDFNLDMLENTQLQEKIIHQAIDATRDAKASELIIDLELSALPFTKLQTQITTFLTLFAQQAKEDSLSFGITVYGDQFYRHRPFDLQTLSPSIDTFYIMAYDFHKSSGSPGPNFPLTGKEKFGTDLHELADQLLSLIPSHKINVIFGLYGYDWIVDENKRPIQRAKAIPLKEIKSSFLNNCVWKNCVVTRDPLSFETEVDYIDEELKYHIVWFEDESSFGKKITFLKSKGIMNSSFWVWGYY